MSELKKDSVERTLCIPLWSRAIAAKKLPQILPDHDAVRILKEMGETKPPTVLYNLECGALQARCVSMISPVRSGNT